MTNKRKKATALFTSIVGGYIFFFLWNAFTPVKDPCETLKPWRQIPFNLADWRAQKNMPNMARNLIDGDWLKNKNKVEIMEILGPPLADAEQEKTLRFSLWYEVGGKFSCHLFIRYGKPNNVFSGAYIAYVPY